MVLLPGMHRESIAVGELEHHLQPAEHQLATFSRMVCQDSVHSGPYNRLDNLRYAVGLWYVLGWDELMVLCRLRILLLF